MISEINIYEDIAHEKTEIGGSSVTVYGNIKDVNHIADYARHMRDTKNIVVKKDIDKNEDMVSHPAHYNNNGMECIDEMILLYGVEETMSFCKLNAHKYRKRAIYKNGEEDQKKSDWYLAKYKELKESKNKKAVSSYNAIPNNIVLS